MHELRTRRGRRLVTELPLPTAELGRVRMQPAALVDTARGGLAGSLRMHQLTQRSVPWTILARDAALFVDVRCQRAGLDRHRQAPCVTPRP